MNLASRVEFALGRTQYDVLRRSVARLRNFVERSATIFGVSVPFLVSPGWGVPIVLLHGFGDSKETWLVLASLLARRRSIIIPDLPGFGAAGDIAPERAAPRHQAAVVAGLLDELAVSRAHLVGNSMGGGITLRFAYDFPERATSMTLISSAGPYLEMSEMQKALERGENPLVIARVEEWDAFMKFICERQPKATRAIGAYLAHSRMARSHKDRDLFQGFVRPKPEDDMPQDLESIQTPALVIHGQSDRVIHPSTAQALAARLPHARLELMSGVGHIAQIESPLPVARWINAFTDAHDRMAAVASPQS